jgi:serine protease Do
MPIFSLFSFKDNGIKNKDNTSKQKNNMTRNIISNNQNKFIRSPVIVSLLILSWIFIISTNGFSFERIFIFADISNNISNSTVKNNPFSLSDIFSFAQKSVVQITNFNSSGPITSGTGIVYDKLGHIITNYHVIQGQENNLSDIHSDVKFLDGTVYSAKVVGVDPLNDIAVLLAEDMPKEKLIPIQFGNSSNMNVGEQVAAFGFPTEAGTLTSGIISSKDVLGPLPYIFQGVPFRIPGVFATDATINHGNSGGPLFNLKGEVIGINTFGDLNAEHIAYAIPSNTITKVVPSLINSGVFLHPWLGIEGNDITSEIAKLLNLKEPKGFLVTDVQDQSPAQKADIQGGNKLIFIPNEGRNILTGGDVIVKLDGKNIRNLADILIYLQTEKKVGDNLEITLLRNTEYQNVNTTLEAQPVLGR